MVVWSDGKETIHLSKLETPRLADAPGSFCMYVFRALDGLARGGIEYDLWQAV